MRDLTRGPFSSRADQALLRPSSGPAQAQAGLGSAQLGLDEGWDDADDGGVVVPCDVLFVELGGPGWLDVPEGPVSVGWPDRPVLVGSVADDDP